MGQSLVQNYVHLVFSTKYRYPFIDDAIEDELFDYLGGTCNELNCQVLNVGGYRDHVHILCMLNKNITLAELLSKVKSSSSKWIKTKGFKYKNFSWQNGYGSFSVSKRAVPYVRNYIVNQREHHERKSFKKEFVEFLEQYGIDYDERYVWD